MKIKILVGLVCTLALNSTVVSQNLKIGYTNADYILSLMPEAKQIQAELESYEKQLDNQLQAKITEYQKKGQEYQNLPANTSEVIRKDKETELGNLQNSIQAFQQQAQNSLIDKRTELLEPAYVKINDVIQEVSIENNFTHIFSTDAGGGSILLWAREEDNISNLILAKMGITPPSNN